jgi:hypothetical protein
MSDDIFAGLNDTIQKAIQNLPPEQRQSAAKSLGEDFHRITRKIAQYNQQKDFQRREGIFAQRFNEFVEQNNYRPSLEIQWQWRQELSLNQD